MLDDLLGGTGGGIATRLAEELGIIERTSHDDQCAGERKTHRRPTIFWRDLLRRRRVHAVDRLLRSLSFEAAKMKRGPRHTRGACVLERRSAAPDCRRTY